TGHRPAAGSPAPPPAGSVLRDMRRELRKEAEGLRRRPVALVVPVASIRVSAAVPEAVPAERVEFAGARGIERQPQVSERHDVLLEPITPMAARLRHRVALYDHVAFSVDDVCGIGYAVVARIGPRPVG